MAAQHRRPGSPGVYPPAHLGSPQGPSTNGQKCYSPSMGVVARARVISAFQSTRLHQGLKDENGMAPAVDKAPGHTTVSTSTSHRRPLWSAGSSCCRMCVRVSRLESVYVMVSETSNDMACSSDREQDIWFQLPSPPSWRYLPSIAQAGMGICESSGRPNNPAYLHELTNEIRARSACIRQAPWAPQ